MCAQAAAASTKRYVLPTAYRDLTMHNRLSIMVSMANRLRMAQRMAVVKALVEGNSIRATVRMTGVAKNTIQKLVLDLGAVVADYQDRAFMNLTSKRIQCDEIW